MTQLKKAQSTLRFAAVGECMIELSHLDEDQLQQSFAGDTFNVCVYFERCLNQKQAEIEFVSAIGSDPYSVAMKKFWASEHVQGRYTHVVKNKLPGLYFIRTDSKGERKFYYYRSDSAAKQMFSGHAGDQLAQHLKAFEMIYFSGISLAILDDSSREKFYQALVEAKKNGAVIGFDSNYRPILWQSAAIAKQVMERFLSLVNIALPSYDDEYQLYADRSMKSCAARIKQLGVEEVVVKSGEKGCFVDAANICEKMPVPKVNKIIDTTAAGDSFNGAYLAFRAQGLSVGEAVKKAMQVSAKVIQYPGAIISKDIKLG